jgi:hypothetical protein
MARSGNSTALLLRGLVLLVATTGQAHATGISAFLEPGYVNEHTEVTDKTGKTTLVERQAFRQNYRLDLGIDLTQTLLLSASGTFADTASWTVTNGLTRTQDQPALGLLGRLSYTTPTLAAGAWYERNQQWGTQLYSPLLGETATAFATWRPFELPTLDLRFSRARYYDSDSLVQDTNVTTALLNTRYGFRFLDLRYTFNWTSNEDVRFGTKSSIIDQLVQASLNENFFGQRLTTYATVALQPRSITTESVGQQGTVSRQLFPIAGLSVVEIFPATSVQVTLASNPALIDGNTTASAGIDIGFGPSLAGDRNPRNIGAQLLDEVTPLNTLHVWVDRQLPPEVVNSMGPTFTAYRSSDNVSWVPVPIVGPVVFGAFQNRFEVTIAQTQTRYIKVVTTPLAAGVTSDRVFANIFVTEIQTFLVTPASAVPNKVSTMGLVANGSAKVSIFRVPNLDYDFSIYFNRQTNPGVTTYTVTNGVTFGSRLGSIWGVSARVARQDTNPGTGNETLWQWTASLVARPLPAATTSLTYSGQVTGGFDRSQVPMVPTTALQQSLSLFGRADLYEGVSLQANLSGSNSLDPNQRATNLVSANATLALIPNPYMSLTTTYGASSTWTSGGFLPDDSTRAQRLESTLILLPWPSLSGSATVTWDILALRPTVLATFQLNFNPLRGNLQLGFSFTRTLNTAADTITQVIYPSIRWNIRPGVFLNAAYFLTDISAPVVSTASRTLTTSLLISL